MTSCRRRPKNVCIHMVLHEKPPGWEHHPRDGWLYLRADYCLRGTWCPEDYEGFRSGAAPPEYLRYDRTYWEITPHFFQGASPVASVCHGIGDRRRRRTVFADQGDTRRQMRLRRDDRRSHLRR